MTEKSLSSYIKSKLTLRNTVGFITRTSTKFVVTTAVTKIVQPEKPIHKVETAVGGYVLGSMLAEHADEYVMRKYDAAAGEVKTALDDEKTEDPIETDLPVA